MVILAPFKVIFAISLFVTNTIATCLILFLLASIQFFTPWWRPLWQRLMITAAEIWISINDFNFYITQNIRWRVNIPEHLSQDKSYLIIANHRSWMDIPVIQHAFNRKIPFIRFFIKHELSYIPLMGWAWRILNYPFVKRHSKSVLERQPEKRFEDQESIKRACEKFKGIPVTLLNFVEGTRFTNIKQKSLNSPFKNLLPPKIGGIALVLCTMGNQFAGVLDVTIAYPKGAVSLWQVFCGKLNEVIIQAELISIPQKIAAINNPEDPESRIILNAWIQEIWRKKDNQIQQWISAT